VTADTEQAPGFRPRQSPQVRQFAVGDELVLVMSHQQVEVPEEAAGSRALTLNASGRAIWDLCDGHRSLGDIADALAQAFSVDRAQLLTQAGHALSELSQLGFIEGFDQRASDRS